MAQTFGPAESIGRGAVEYQSPNALATADGCAVIAVGLNLEFTAGPVATRAYVDAAIQTIALTPGPQGPAGANGAQGPVGPNTVSGTTATALLGLLYGNGSNVAIASSANVVTALGYTPANRAGDTFTGNVITGNANYVGWTDAQLRQTAAGAVGAFGADGTTAGTFRANFFANSGGVGIQTTPGDLLTTWGFNNGLLVIPPSFNIAWAASWGAPFVLSNNSVIIGRGSGTVFQTQSADGLRVRNLANDAFAPITASTISLNTVVSSIVTMQRGITNYSFEIGAGDLLGLFDIRNARYAWRVGTNQLFVGENGQHRLVIGTPTDNGSDRLQVNGGATFSDVVRLGVFTVATLPSASANASRVATVTDSSVTTNGSPVAGGGSNRVMVFSNGTTWDVVVA